MLLTNEQKAELWADREYIRGTTSWERNRDCALEILRNAEIISGHSHAPQSPGVEGETDLDKKVKEVVERWCLRLPSSQSGSARVEQVDDLIAEVRALYQQDAERREEEAIKLMAKIRERVNVYWKFDDQWHAHSWHDKQDCLELIDKMVAAFRSREGQEG